MLVKKFDDLSLEIIEDNNSYQLKGLKVQNFILENKFLHSNSILDFSWDAKIPHSAKQHLSFKALGEYHPNHAHDILKCSAFDTKAVDLRISLDNKLIVGKFLITQYEITSSFDQFIEFEINFINASQITYSFTKNNNK